MQQMELKFCTCDAYVFFPSSSSSVECNVQPTIFYLHVNVRGVNWIAIQIWMFLIWNFMKLSLQKSELRFENNRSVKILHENLIMLKKKMYAKKNGMLCRSRTSSGCKPNPTQCKHSNNDVSCKLGYWQVVGSKCLNCNQKLKCNLKSYAASEQSSLVGMQKLKLFCK